VANTYTPNAKLAMPAPGDRIWNVPVNGNAQIVDAANAVGDLAVTTHEQPSASLLVDVAGGLYLNQTNVVSTYAAALSVAVAASSTTSIYLTNAGALTQSVVGFPAAPTVYVPLAVVVSGPSTITSITDARVPFSVAGTAMLPLAGGTLSDGANIVVGTATGTKIGTATNQKLGFFGHAPVVQPTVGATAAGATYTSVEQGLINTLLAAIRALGLGS
jgi:hypothetical protein